MNLKRFGIALFAVVALGAIMASSAFAASETFHSHVYIGTTGQANGFKETVKCSAGEHEGSKVLKLNGTIGEGAGTPVELQATGINCIKHLTEGTEPGATILQTGTTAETLMVEDLGRLEFTGVSVTKPTGCTTSSTITTNPLKSEIFTDVAEPKIAFDKFEPTGTTFASVTISGCSVAGTYAVKGSAFGQFVNLTGVSAVNQPLTFSSGIETTAGGTLKFAGNTASLTGRVNNELSGANAGKEFSAKTS